MTPGVLSSSLLDAGVAPAIVTRRPEECVKGHARTWSHSSTYKVLITGYSIAAMRHTMLHAPHMRHNSLQSVHSNGSAGDLGVTLACL